MEPTPKKPKAALIVFLFLLLLILNNHTCQVHSRNLAIANSPSHAPGPATATATYKNKRSFDGRIRKANPIPRQGSFPATICHSKCNQCRPCVPVEVSIRTTMVVEENQYYPIAWRCMCHTNIFSP
ncbi:EPIDERMAL PATTERNING FACTOR-like protein 5 [Lotus japonicus]|uniref:EPIDERMAL PATTERNING FACTOR-like protein 5 n=1 Tax=Lotus japonicus TaxID=34305 RepID=UPI00258F9791|nr:EPIDERMAL PATTERNING FACTOR-like protein 5 [Lotus japonicus]